MSYFKVHGDETKRVIVNKVDLPTLATPWGQLHAWFRTYVLPRLDISKKWSGCWMWTGATNERGEPRIYYTSLKRERGRTGRRRAAMVKHEMVKQMDWLDTKRVPRRRYDGDDTAVPDIDIVHLCGNPSCLNPAHMIACLDDAKQRDLDKLRDKYLAPGTYYVP